MSFYSTSFPIDVDSPCSDRPLATPNQSPLQDVTKRPGPVKGTSEDISIGTCKGSLEGLTTTLIGEEPTSEEAAQSSTCTYQHMTTRSSR